jgi:leader peptidase (prepilin peptidase)/N-methyltransferase
MFPMLILFILIGFLLGMLVNLLADSLPRYRDVRGYHCVSCGAKRKPFLWSALISFLTGNRKCAYCGDLLEWRAPLVEISMAVGGYLIYQSDPTLSVVFPRLVVLFIYVLIAVIDIEHRLILHIVSGPSAVIIFILSFMDPEIKTLDILIGGLVGFFSFLLLYFLGQLFAILMGRLRGTQIQEVAFGFGDVTLAGVIGLTLGWQEYRVVAALIAGILFAGVFSFLYIIVRLFRKSYTPFMPIPYGPFLIVACLLVYF